MGYRRLIHQDHCGYMPNHKLACRMIDIGTYWHYRVAFVGIDVPDDR